MSIQSLWQTELLEESSYEFSVEHSDVVDQIRFRDLEPYFVGRFKDSKSEDFQVTYFYKVFNDVLKVK